ncbi:manganese catalase family protein [Mucilaginibacter myungsuensis]|uniref:Manganese catalase family protein n=1 Tax=Mucilaginibacter myungsuensis TaxID=649104 RepID=A0A929KTI5_9SPHI|nr:manganese catalase family protein [Mucilaginibacter myungsuensis]MBE9660512.1 manganese catalase family protein [Mucilaginibacter myungsuensis]MDN3600556.1 manganese catalase family protein [Mucilaginibacter myungsuensis]
MFHHVKDLQFNARVSRPDPRFANLLLEQFGGENGELAAAMQYFTQAFGAKQPHPDKYDMLMDIAVEEFSHLEIVGATIQMLLKGVNGEMKNAAEQSEIMQVMDGKATKESIIHAALTANPQFPIITGGGPTLRNSQGIPWCASYIHSNGDLTVDLRSNLASESRAKLVYEHLMKFTDDPYVKETLSFLMTREVTHYKMFEAALDTIQPNFPPAVLGADPRFLQQVYNLSDGTVRGPWNEGEIKGMGKDFVYVEDPITYVTETEGQTKQPKEMAKALAEKEKLDKQMSQVKSDEVKKAEPEGVAQWSTY